MHSGIMCTISGGVRSVGVAGMMQKINHQAKCRALIMGVPNSKLRLICLYSHSKNEACDGIEGVVVGGEYGVRWMYGDGRGRA